MKIKLKKAIKHKGQEIYTLDIPLEDLTGNDLIDVEKQLVQSGEVPIVTDFNRVYLINIAAKAVHMPVEILKEASAKDFTRITNEVRNFLTLSDSDENEEEGIPEKLPATSSGESQSD
ncbi:MAG: phage tail assembly protein [Synergistaceae bacterium]|nr:phage tail assembly protein [Synergistaceae bacterium]